MRVNKMYGLVAGENLITLKVKYWNLTSTNNDLYLILITNIIVRNLSIMIMV